MKLIYMDEAGNTGTRLDPDQPIHLLSAVIVDETQVRQIEIDMRAIAERYFGETAGRSLPEFHGYEICKGRGVFKKMTVDTRIALMGELVGVITAHNLAIGYTGIDKLRYRVSAHPHQLAFLFLVERIEDLLRNANVLGLIISDENHDMEQTLIDDIDQYKRKDTGWGYRPTPINCIIDTIHFVRSKNNWLIQLADVVAYLVLRGIRTYRHITKLPDYHGSRLPLREWVDRNASSSQKLDIDFLLRLQPLLKFAKMFPDC